MGSLQYTILVTGGAGFIGTHTVVQLLNDGFRVSIFDNLSNSVIEAVDRVRELVGSTLSQNLDFHLVRFRFSCFDCLMINFDKIWIMKTWSFLICVQGDVRNKEDLEKLFSHAKYVLCIYAFSLDWLFSQFTHLTKPC